MIILAVILSLAAGLYVASESSYVQTRLAKWLASGLSKELDARVEIDKVNIDFFNKVVLKGLLIYDQQGDTLLYSGRFRAMVSRLNRRDNTYRFSQIGMDSTMFRLKQIDAGGGTNLDFLTERFKTKEGDPNAPRQILSLSSAEVLLRNTKFSYRNPYGSEAGSGVDFNDIFIDHLRGTFRDFQFIGDSLGVVIEDFHFTEHSGFVLDSLVAHAVLTSERLELSGLILRTENSDLEGNVSLKHGTWANYAHFVDSVNWDAQFNHSTLNFIDIGFFTPGLYGVNLPISLSGKVRGTIADLKGRDLRLGTVGHTVLNGDIDLAGLPDFENTFIDWRIGLLSLDYEAIDEITFRLMSDRPADQTLPKELKRAGALRFQGSFTGFPRDFVAFGDLQTAVGDLSLDLNFERDTVANRIEYRGGLKTRDFDIGRILEIDSLGMVSAALQVVAYSKGEFQSATLNGSIDRLDFSGYEYENIALDGTLSPQKFTGQLSSFDPNADFNFDGTIDFSRDVPYYDFAADIRNINFTELKLVDFPEEFSFSSQVALRATGGEIGNFIGQLTATNTFLCYGDSSLFLDDLGLSMSGDSAGRRINFDSDVVDLTITGIFDPAELPAAFANLAVDILPSFRTEVPITRDEVFDFSVNYRSSQTIIGFLVPGLYISANTTAYGQFNSVDGVFNAFLRSDKIAYKNVIMNDITLDLGKVSEVAKGKMYASRAEVGNLIFENPSLELEGYNDTVDMEVEWLNENGTTSGDLRASIDLYSKDRMILKIEPGVLGLSGVNWSIDSLAVVSRDSSHYTIENFRMSSDRQFLSVEGEIGENRDDSLQIAVNGLRISSLDSMGFDPGKRISGTIDLQASIQGFYNERILEARGTVDGLEIEGKKIGNVNVASKYMSHSDSLSVDATLLKEGTKLIDYHGQYAIKSEEPLTGVLILDDFDLDALNAFDIPEVSNFRGMADGSIRVSGSFQKPLLEGYIDFEDAWFTVDYLNVNFRFSDRVRVENDFIGIDYKPIYDERGNRGFVVASAFHHNFSDWNYDISADVTDFLVLNTTREMNNLYFGQAAATGNLSISGYEGMLEVNIDATTEKGTDVKLPLDGTEEVAMEDFVHFTTGHHEEEESTHDIDLKGVRMSLNIEATPDAQVQLIFDEAAGDILRGRGSGRLTLETTPAGEFNMFGRYEVVSGTYNFTMRSLINKQFTLRPGGVIGWYGDPYGADLELSAVYDLRTPLYPVMIENRDLYRNREPVNVVLKLGGKLFEPSIEFEIELPQAGSSERSQLASAVNTTNELNQQVFSLLILNRFMDITAIDQGRAMASGARALYSANTSEFISNQLSSWLSDISKEFDIGINYRPGDEVSNQEIAVALSTQLFNERLAVSGNFGVTTTTDAQLTQGQSGILGDFLIEYRLTEDGKIRLKVFNETNPYEVFSTSNSLYTQGVGLIYREEFDTLDEFFQKIGKLFTNDKVEKDDLP